MTEVDFGIKVDAEGLIINHKAMKSLFYKPSITAMLLLAAVAFNGCDKYDKDIVGEIEIYLLDEYNQKPESSAILNTGMVLEATPVVAYAEIIGYDATTCTFDLEPAAAARLQDLYQSAFAVTISGEIVYTGYFWSGLSSQIVDWVVADLVTLEMSGELKMDLGYPYLMEGMNIPDDRNDNRLLSVFHRDGKLID
ncbi:MAG: hypothetical protein E4G92_02230 [Bacteroidia bacterium]|nr:MAG: hypothetical protein E4G92_02230 [Bacteroidia bacterium]